MLQVFKALIYLNEKQVIHGDLKLENILVSCHNKDESKIDNSIDKKRKRMMMKMDLLKQ